MIFLLGCASSPPMPPPMAVPPVPPTLAPVVAETTWVQPAPWPDPPKHTAPIIREATEQAILAPHAHGFRQARLEFPFTVDAVYRLDTAVYEPTTLLLQPGEMYQGLDGGDDKQWKTDVSWVGEGEEARTVVTIIPTEIGKRVRMALRTSKGLYHLEVRSRASHGLVAVSWRHATPPRRAVRPIAREWTIGYGVAGDETLPWWPVFVWSDATHTYLLFGQTLKTAGAPIVTVLGPSGPELVNYRVHGYLYIIDAVFDRAELRLGSGTGTALQVVRTEQARVITCPGDEACAVIAQGMRWLEDLAWAD